MKQALTVLGAVASLAGLFIAYSAWAGPLDPPAGPVTSTYKTLTEVEPRTAINTTNTPGDADSLFKITQPGSYYLTGNITGVAGRHGVEIAASGVTLDLMGFDLSGLPASLDGVSATVSNLTNITVRNGSVRAWGDEGVDLGTNSADNSAVIDVRASGNAGSGILAHTGCTITGCTAYDNGGNGITTDNGCTISNCTASFNTANGISTGNTCTITGCSAYANGGNGISTNSVCTITGCSASQNSGDGILISSGTINNCMAWGNDGNGISAGGSATITSCHSIANQANGISAGSGCTISNNSVRASNLNGIAVTGDCLVLANACSVNGFPGIGGGIGDGAGIHATGADNRIEGNNCTDADRGIDVDVAGNIIIRNTCSGNTINWSIAIGNSFGPIVVAGTNAAVVNTNGAVAGNLGSTDPNANFSY